MATQSSLKSNYFQSEENSPVFNDTLKPKKLEDTQPQQPDLVKPNDPSTFSDEAAMPSALKVELQMLEPIWFEALSRENKGASDEQVQTHVNLKLEQAREIIPSRWKAEKKFTAKCRNLDQIYDSLAQVLVTLQAKEIDDPLVRTKDYQAQKAISDWTKIRQPEIEAIYQEATRVWYKPECDPPTSQFVTIMNKFGNLIARYAYESSIRPPLGGFSNSAPVSHEQFSFLMEQFVVTSHIDTFDGDLKHSDASTKFSQWKIQWEALVQEMKTMFGFSKVLLFEKLKQVLSKAALKLVSRHPGSSQHSYDAAIRDLSEKYDFHVNCGLTQRKTPFQQLEFIKESFNGLQNLKDMFESENVDIFNFALTSIFLKSMSKDMENKWDQHKIQVKKDYQSRHITAEKNGETLPKWKCGMVENYEQFNAWLRLQNAKVKQSTPKIDRPMKRPHSLAFSEAKPQFLSKKTSGKKEQDCFICGPFPTHFMSRCRRALSMSFVHWKVVCQRQSICFKCGSSYNEEQ